MESANHEFTWMSGHAHHLTPSTSCSAQSPSAGRKSPSPSSTSVKSLDAPTYDDVYESADSSASCRPTPLPRTVAGAGFNQQVAVEVQAQIAVAAAAAAANNKSSPSAKRPIPLPRIFRRLSSSSASTSTTSSSTSSSAETPSHIISNTYDIVSAPSSTFYVPSTNYAEENAQKPANCSVVVDKSVIREFDPIMQSTDADAHVDHERCESLGLLQSIEQELLQQRSRDCNPWDESGVDNQTRDLPRDKQLYVHDAAPTSSLFSSVTAISSRLRPNQRQNVIVAQVTQSPELPPKSANNAQLKFGLSTVPPPPVSVSELPSGLPSEDNSVPLKVSSPIHIDNPCYMFVGMMPNNSAARSRRSLEIREVDDKILCNSDVDFDDGDTGFHNVGAAACKVLVDNQAAVSKDLQFPVHVTEQELNDDNDYATPPNAIINSSELQCPPAPRRQLPKIASGFRVNPKSLLDSAASLLELKLDTLPTETLSVPGIPKYRQFPLPAYVPIYQNLMEISGSSEGVYAQIRKAGATSVASNLPTLITKSPPPPLPPRGKQRAKDDVESSAGLGRTLSRRSEQLTEVIRNIPHSGHLFKVGRNRKEIVQKWVVLERGHLQLYVDEKSANPQNIFHQSDMISVGRGQDVKFNHRDMPCFELTTTSNSSAAAKERPYMLGTKYAHERDAWIHHVIQAFAPSISMMTDSNDICKAGYVQMRKAVSGIWHEHWMVLSGKTLSLWSMADSSSLLELDLRKVTFMQEYESDPQASMAVKDDQPLFVVHYPDLTLYVMSKVVFDTADWFRRLRQASLETGRGLEDQQLTHDDVPVVVDKCLNFVSTYGISTKGIYRESGTNSKVAKLVDCFHKDAWKVHISSDEYTEHDVANVLKRYLRTLPEALLTKRLYMHWIAAHGLNKREAIEQYIQLLSELPRINYMTLKKLIAHLKSVTELDHMNLMSPSNLAALFGPTLLSTDNDVIMSNSSAEVDVIFDLIANYATIFGVSAEEIEKEEKIQKALQDLREAKRAQKPAGDILVGIYIYSRHWGKCLNVKLSPTMAALDLCQYAIQQMPLRDRLENLVIYEVVCNAEMERPLHHSEIVLAVTLRWACWSDVDARDSYLLLKKSDIFHRIAPLARQPLSMFGELRFADIKSKSFKKFMFEFKNARLSYYKDATISQPLGSWNIEDIVWYIGSDSRRQKPTEWSLTFIEQKAVIKRGTKETPYFGRTICFSCEEELYRWMAAMLTGQYPNGILPIVPKVDVLT